MLRRVCLYWYLIYILLHCATLIFVENIWQAERRNSDGNHTQALGPVKDVPYFIHQIHSIDPYTSINTEDNTLVDLNGLLGVFVAQT